MKEIEKVLKALANKRRLAIIAFLKKTREGTVTEVAGEINLSFRSTSRHLMILYNAEIIDKRQQSTEVYYWLSVKNSNVASSIVDLL